MYKGKFQFRLANIYFLLQSQGHLDQGRKLCQNSFPVHAQVSACIRIFTKCYFTRTGGNLCNITRNTTVKSFN